jgi:hypothetical protein
MFRRTRLVGDSLTLIASLSEIRLPAAFAARPIPRTALAAAATAETRAPVRPRRTRPLAAFFPARSLFGLLGVELVRGIHVDGFLDKPLDPAQQTALFGAYERNRPCRPHPHAPCGPIRWT